MTPWRSGTMLALAAVAVAALALLLLSQPAAGAEVELTLVGTMPSAASGVAVSGDHAYVAATSGLLVLDISDPAAPSREAFLPLPDGSARGVAVAGDYTYVAGRSGGLVVVNVSDPTDPTRVGGYDTDGDAYGVAVAGGYAYVADGSGGLVVVNVSDPTDPTYAGGYDTSGDAWDVAAAGGYAYVADRSGGLVVVNVSDPTDPTYAGGYDTAGRATGVAVAGDYAYIADSDGGLVVVNVSDPADPTRVGGYDTSEYAYGVAVAGGYAYVADYYGGLVVVNVSDPADPVRVGGYDTSGYAWGVAVAGDYAYVADRHNGLVVVNVSDPTDPTRAGGYDTAGWAWGVAVAGDYAYVANSGKGLVVVNVSDPTDPTYAGGYDTAGRAYGVAVAGGYAYVADRSGGLVVVNVSDPTDPVRAGGYVTAGEAWGVAVVGDYAYVAAEDGGLVVVDVSDPTDPTRVGGYDTTGYAYGVAVAGDYAYVADGYKKLVVVNVSDPADPTRVGGYDTAGTAFGVAVTGGYVYVADYGGGLVVVDVSDPTDPVRVGGYDTAGTAFGVAVAGGYAYVADYGGGLVVVDVSDPTDPTRVGGYDTAGDAQGVAVVGGYVYVAADDGGLQIFHIGLYATIVSISPNPANEGEMVSFIGYGFDPDGNITGYRWRSSLDGDLGTNASFNTSSLSVGIHTIYFKVQAENGNWSEEVNRSLKINSFPDAIIDSIAPSPANEGEEVTFEGHGTDDDGTITGYLWLSSRDGLLNTNATFTTSSLTPGTHAIYLSVQDNDGAWSPWVTATLHINALPTALIDSLSPSPVLANASVTLTGNGTDPDGAAVAYRWRSSLDDDLSADATFTTSSLSPGTHTIYFSVQDNDGAWSTNATATLVVNLPPTAVIDSVSPPAATEGEPVAVAGNGTDPDGEVVAYLWTSDIDGPLSNSASLSLTNLTPGNHTLYFAVQDDLGFWSEEVTAPLFINARPVAAIANDTAAFAHAGRPVLLNGSGSDADGEVVEYLWESDRDGPLGNGSRFTLINLTPGNHNLSFSVRDDFGAWSAAAEWSLRVNARPSLVALSLEPQIVLAGEPVSFRVSASDRDGDVTGYYFSLNHPGGFRFQYFLPDDFDPLPTVNLQPGNYTVALSAGDNEGGLSDALITWLYVNVPPLAVIDEISVVRAANGTIAMTLAGHGEDDETIAALAWRSDLDGPLGAGNSLMLYNLTPGTHTFSLRVRDELGAWSEWEAWGEPVTVAVAGTGGETTGILGLEGNILVLLLVVLLAVVLGGGLAGWQYQSHLHATRIQPTLERLRSLTEQTRLAGLEYPRDQFQRVMERLTVWRYRSMQAEAALLEKRMNETLDLFVEAEGLLTKARELAAEAEAAGVEFERALLESAEGAFEARELEDSKWAAAAFIEKVEGLLKEEKDAAEAAEGEGATGTREPPSPWARPGAPNEELAQGPSPEAAEGEAGALEKTVVVEPIEVSEGEAGEVPTEVVVGAPEEAVAAPAPMTPAPPGEGEEGEPVEASVVPAEGEVGEETVPKRTEQEGRHDG